MIFHQDPWPFVSIIADIASSITNKTYCCWSRFEKKFVLISISFFSFFSFCLMMSLFILSSSLIWINILTVTSRFIAFLIVSNIPSLYKSQNDLILGYRLKLNLWLVYYFAKGLEYLLLVFYCFV